MARVAAALGVLVLVAPLSEHWLADLATQSRLVATVGLLFACGLCLMRSRLRLAALLLALALPPAYAVAPLFLGGGQGPPQAADLRLVIANVRLENPDRAELLAELQAQDADVIVLVEPDTPWLEAAAALLASSHPHRVFEARTDAFGIGLFSRLPLAWTAVRHAGPLRVPVIGADLLSDPPIRLLAAHAPPPFGAAWTAARDATLAELAGWAATFAADAGEAGDARRLVIIGDLNTSPWTPSFDRFLAAARVSNPRLGRGPRGTYPAWAGLLGLPLDHILPSAGLGVSALETLRLPGSDHRALAATLAPTR